MCQFCLVLSSVPPLCFSLLPCRAGRFDPVSSPLPLASAAAVGRNPERKSSSGIRRVVTNPPFIFCDSWKPRSCSTLITSPQTHFPSAQRVLLSPSLWFLLAGATGATGAMAVCPVLLCSGRCGLSPASGAASGEANGASTSPERQTVASLLIPGGGGGACWEPRPPAGQPVRVGLASSFIYWIHLILVGIILKAESSSRDIFCP